MDGAVPKETQEVERHCNHKPNGAKSNDRIRIATLGPGDCPTATAIFTLSRFRPVLVRSPYPAGRLAFLFRQTETRRKQL